MSSDTNLMTSLEASFPKFQKNESGDGGIYKINPKCHVMVLEDVDPKNWMVHNPSSSEEAPVKVSEITGAIKLIIAEFVGVYNEFKAEKKPTKDPIDTLKKHGFVEAPQPEGNEVVSPEQLEVLSKGLVEGIAADEKLEADKKAQLEADAQKQRELDEKLAEMDRLEDEEREAQERKIQDMDKREKTREVPTPAVKNEQLRPKAVYSGSDVTLLNIVEKYIKNDLVQIFGDTGTGKTSISMKIANDSRKEGRTVLYIDTEHNTTDEQAEAVKANGIEYVYIPDFDDMYQYVRKIPAYDVVIIDSMGLPVLNLYATMNMKERGDALLKMIALTAFLKKYANTNKALIVVTNQPESDFNKDPKTARRPFGDKSQFNTKEIFRTVFAHNGRLENKTTIILKAYRSRTCGMDSRICNVEISDSGVKVVA